MNTKELLYLCLLYLILEDSTSQDIAKTETKRINDILKIPMSTNNLEKSKATGLETAETRSQKIEVINIADVPLEQSQLVTFEAAASNIETRTLPVAKHAKVKRTTTEQKKSIIPTSMECGFPASDRVVMGEETNPGENPWLVGVGIVRRNRFLNMCGGTLITKKHVLTATHCFILEIMPTHVILGEHSMSRNIEAEPPLILKILERRGKGFDRETYLNDIEIITMEHEVEFTEYIQPACLPMDFQNENFDNVAMTIVGWGDTVYNSSRGHDTPLKADIEVVPKAECKKAYKKYPQLPLDKTQMCAGRDDKDTCQGDSGGPLLYFDYKQHYRFFVVGIVSYGIECGVPEFPGIYTYVPEFMDWIVKQVSQ